MFYTQATAEVCTAALLLDVDPVALVRGHGTYDQYVNDRPYVASSMMSVALAEVFGTALAGNCKPRPQLAETPIPLVACMASLPCRGGAELLARLFEPLGYALSVTRHRLDDIFAWGTSDIFTVELAGTQRLCDLLSHLYVLIPVLDNEKHYFVGDAEVEKLLRHGEGWLATHPAREVIAARYLKYRRGLVDEAIRQLRTQDGEAPRQIDAETAADPREERGERALSLHERRHGVVCAVLQARQVRTVADLGCGEGRLLRELTKIRSLERIIGLDVSHRVLELAADRLRLEQLPPLVRQRIELLHGSLMYRDDRLSGLDAAILCEVVEHLDPPRLQAMERVVFDFARPRIVVLTTPNREYNMMWESLPAGEVRHRDHRFEWTRAEFQHWCGQVGQRFGYGCQISGIGDPATTPAGQDVGTPTQMGVFTRE